MKKILIAGVASLAFCSVAMAQNSNSGAAGATANTDHNQASGGVPGSKPGSGSATVPYSPVPNPGYVTPAPSVTGSVTGSPGMPTGTNSTRPQIPGGVSNGDQDKGNGNGAGAGASATVK